MREAAIQVTSAASSGPGTCTGPACCWQVLLPRTTHTSNCVSVPARVHWRRPYKVWRHVIGTDPAQVSGGRSSMWMVHAGCLPTTVLLKSSGEFLCKTQKEEGSFLSGSRLNF